MSTGNSITVVSTLPSDASVTQAAHGFVVGNLIYATTTLDVWAKAVANDPIKMANAFVSSVPGTTVFTYKEFGTLELTTGQWDAVTGQSGGLTAGHYYWLNQTTAGAITTTQPASGYIQCVGKAFSTTVMDVSVDIAVSATGSPVNGTVTVDFGAGPGANEASAAVTGQTNIAATNIARAFVVADDTTADHAANDHKYFAMLSTFTCDTPVAATGFNVYARSAEKLTGQFKVRWNWS